ncbi:MULTISPECIES: amidase [unclassified Rhodococcus (in: high G+C Gram-positive bacteria)]|uniref:amidase n=1 Tax=unclassified Rhodococcus (in: high G+C Gram-positive bacteria) TaxID=192944 RepID=UPI001FFB9A37|nr:MULTISPECIES: amidase [unclassified Rhodococcus (in: high G+C Gram-positive bacteria)]
MLQANSIDIDARSLAEAVSSRSMSAHEVIEQHLAHIDRENPRLNAIVTVAAESARQAADEIDARLARGESVGALAGVPFTVKDLIATAGVRTTAGSTALAGNVPRVDAPAVARMRAEGAILIGKTNTPEFGASGLTHNDLFGYTLNPLSPDGIDRSPGGSSGGEASAIASGMSVVGLGTDFGGSVRWPAHCTGLCSVRPTGGRISPDGQYPGVMFDERVLTNAATMHGSVQTIGPMARNLDDLVLMLRVTSSPEYRWLDPAGVRLDELDVRWAAGEGTVPVSAEIVAAVTESADRLAPSVNSMRPYSGTALRKANDLFTRMRAAETQTDILQYGPATGFGANIREILAAVRPAHSTDAEALWAERSVLRHELLSTMGDVLILPVASIVAPPIGETRFDVDGTVLSWSEALASSRAISILGVPSVVVPVATSESGLPIGVQIVARPWQEHNALAAAALCMRPTQH